MSVQYTKRSSCSRPSLFLQPADIPPRALDSFICPWDPPAEMKSGWSSGYPGLQLHFDDCKKRRIAIQMENDAKPRNKVWMTKRLYWSIWLHFWHFSLDEYNEEQVLECSWPRTIILSACQSKLHQHIIWNWKPCTLKNNSSKSVFLQRCHRETICSEQILKEPFFFLGTVTLVKVGKILWAKSILCSLPVV